VHTERGTALDAFGRGLRLEAKGKRDAGVLFERGTAEVNS
jgi:hypothetical protein